MEIVVDRRWKRDTYTIGNMYINGKFFSNTLEDKDRGLKDSMTPQDISNLKVYGQTAIPSGTYEVKMTYSNRFNLRAWGKKYDGKVPELVNVKGFGGVRIHPFNRASESLGCIAVGKNSITGAVTNSTQYYYKLLDNFIIPAIKNGEKINIIIK